MLILDLLAIHPVADGNGRLARLLTTHELLSQGYGVARYVSIEQRIYDSKNSYYATLYESQRNWHEAEHDVWPWATYLARSSPAHTTTSSAVSRSLVEATEASRSGCATYILHQAPPEFRRRDVERAFPGVSVATIRLVLNELRDAGRIEVESVRPLGGLAQARGRGDSLSSRPRGGGSPRRPQTRVREQAGERPRPRRAARAFAADSGCRRAG